MAPGVPKVLEIDAPMARNTFKIVLIKPSHYDADGYVIQWWRSMIPSNSLASVYGLLTECAEDKILGPDVEIDVDGFDECNTVIDVKGTIAGIRAADGGFVGLVGVQSNQYPRALDLARQFRAAGITVVMGGFHISGCISMLPGLPLDLQQALDMGVTLFAGEGEGRMGEFLCDVHAGTLKPIYNYLSDMPEMADATLPILPRRIVARVAGEYTSFDAGRGCPFQCSFCTIINVQGRKSRFRTPDDVEAIVRKNVAQGVRKFFITDDNFARNRNWEPIVDRLIAMQQEGVKFKLIFQVDTLCHRIPGFIEKLAKAGCNSVFIGMENINPESLAGTKKRQNKIWEYREMLQAWRRAGVGTWAGYILGFPTDTPESVARDIEIIKKELPIDILEFFFLTPLPGSEDHKKLYLNGAPLDPDLNKYYLEHACTTHPRMSKQEWEGVYRDAWARYYTDAHVETILRRAVASPGMGVSKIRDGLIIFSGASRIEGVHPLQFGLGRRKVRTQRRHGMKIVNPLIFYPWRAYDFAKASVQWLSVSLRYSAILRRIKATPEAKSYVDEATRPVNHDGGAQDDFVQFYADKIPHTHGAPQRAGREVVAAE